MAIVAEILLADDDLPLVGLARSLPSGEVSIDKSPVRGDPQATIEKMQQVRRAALAPAQPSGQDRQVAAEARRAIQQARAKLERSEGEAKSERVGDSSPGDQSDRATGGGPSDKPAAGAAEQPIPGKSARSSPVGLDKVVRAYESNPKEVAHLVDTFA